MLMVDGEHGGRVDVKPALPDTMVGEEEVFIDIVDGAVTTTSTPVKPAPKPVDEPAPATTEVAVGGSVLEAEIVTEATGQYEVTWPILGMDCPDCASKATRALKHLDQVWAPQVSPTAGEVRVQIDLSVGTVAEAARVLRSLGHAPNVPHQQLKGVSASSLATKSGVPVARLDRLLRRQPGVLDAEVTRDDRVLLQLLPDAPETLESDRDAALTDLLGSAPTLGLADSDRLRPDQRRLVGGAFAFVLFPIVILMEVLHAPELLLGGLATLAVIIGGAEMFREATAGLRNRQIGFQVLTSMAVIGAVLLKMWEEALIVVILVAFTQHLEGDALVRAREAMQGGLDRLPRTARRSNKPHTHGAIKPMGFSLAPTTMSPMQAPPPSVEEWEEVPIDLVRAGDKLQIRSGELIPADGRIVAGTGSLDMAPLTGESVPVDVETGDELNAGLVLQRGPVEIEVMATGDDTRLSGLIEAVHTFREEPPRLQGLVEQFTAIWVPIVLFGSVVIWRVFYPEDITTMLLLWVVACPCALLLAAPMPHAAILARAAHLGAIVRGGHAMERLAKVDHVLLDKTGTLTSGRPTIGAITVAKGRRRDTAIRLAGGLEVASSHPYALAVGDLLEEENLKPTSVQGLKDVHAGVEGLVKGELVGLYRPDRLPEGVSLEGDLAAALVVSSREGHGASVLVRGSQCVALFTFVHDDGRSGSDEVVKDLYSRGVNVEILSGDLQTAVDLFAERVGMSTNAAHGELTPEDKVRFVEQRSSTHVTMMVGDGFNDAGALAKADVGVAVGTGEQVNLEAADVLIPGDDPRLITSLISLARSANRTLWANLLFSIGVTVILVFAVINNWYDNLWIGVLVHEMSVIVVILNGARLAGSDGWWDLIKGTFSGILGDTRESLSLFASRFRSTS